MKSYSDYHIGTPPSSTATALEHHLEQYSPSAISTLANGHQHHHHQQQQQQQQQHSPAHQHHHQLLHHHSPHLHDLNDSLSPPTSILQTHNAAAISAAVATLPQMPHFGLSGGVGGAYAQTPPSPPVHHGAGGGGGLLPPNSPHHHQQQHHQQQQQHHLAMLPRGLNAGSGGGGGGCGPLMSTGLNSNAVGVPYRPHIEDKKLTRDAMERYMRERNDMVIVILHAKLHNIFVEICTKA
uniref:Protein suppressor of hairless n=1 Tax=Bactrocera latifrons TaxID=174628 RepID=A0A0K8V2A6_BACLA